MKQEYEKLGYGEAEIITAYKKWDYKAKGIIYKSNGAYFLELYKGSGLYLVKKETVKLEEEHNEGQRDKFTK